MLSVALARSAGGAANYFAADNYYTRADADRSGQWLGEGASRLGLKGKIETAKFEALLRGELPDGTRIGREGQLHRAGLDLTFSLPKSWSLLALVGGDARILDAYRSSVIETLQWAERNAAQGRVERGGKERLVKTDNLTIALFQHDTNRNQEPNAHFHAVVANLTHMPDGSWKALRNDKLWSLNTLLNSMTMARFRERVTALGYEAGATLKHGNFEAAGVSRETVLAFSTRRQDILAAAEGMAHQGPKVMDAATLMTRSAKPTIEDRAALAGQWQELAKEKGVDLVAVTARANARAAHDIGLLGTIGAKAEAMRIAARERLAGIAERLGLSPVDPLLPARAERGGSEDMAAAASVASAIRHLSEREAAFNVTDVYKSALDFGLPTTIAPIERQVARLVRNGQLLQGKGRAKEMVTTIDALAGEQRILAEVEAGRGAVVPVVTGDVAAERLQAMAEAKFALRLNGGQEAAGRLILSSANRTVAVQGIAGSGKSTLLRPLAEILREEGRTVVGLAVQNTLVQMLERDTGISSMTVARFLRQHRELLGASPSAAKLAAARGEWAGSVVLLDEASMVGNADQEQLVRLANILELQRFAMIGDRKQLGAVDAGKPFAVLQARGVATATMRLNIRARDDTLRRAQYAAQAGEIGTALELLRPHTIETAGNLAATAAERWLALGPEDRARTAIYVAGRRLRGEVNAAVQDGRFAAGELGTEKLVLDTLVRVNATREELRHAGTYTVGQVVQFAGPNRAQGLKVGEHRIERIDARTGVIRLRDSHGGVQRFRPARMRPGQERDPLGLYERQRLAIHVGDPIRWTANDHKRGLFNADRAEIIGLGKDGVTIRTSAGVEQTLARSDPMLRRLDLAYALNAHMAQGLTSDRGIAVMDSAERKLASKQTFLVTITRLRDSLTLIVDSGERLERAVERNPGVKTSALESVEQIKEGAKAPNAEPAKAKDERQLERSRSRIKDYGL